MNDDAESKLAAPKLFGRKKAATEPIVPDRVDTEAAVPELVDAAPEVAQPAPDVAPEPQAATQPTPAVAPRPAKAPRPPRELPSLPRPRLTGMQMAGVAGILVGLFLVLATYGSLHLCATVRGADTCGGEAGFPLLVAIGILAVVGGGALLRLGGVRSPMGDSFLAVALVAVITVLFLGDHYEAWWMIIAVPLLGLLAYLLAHWVSVTYIDPVDDTDNE